MILKSFLDGFPSLRIPITENNTNMHGIDFMLM